MFHIRVARGLLLMGAIAIAGILPMETAPAGSRGKGPKPRGVPFTVLAQDQFSAIDFPLEAVVRDQDAWDALWALHAGGEPPAVQFDREMVVAVFIGMRANTAYRVRLDRILPVDTGGLLVEYVEEEIRKKGRVFSDIVTTPFVIAVLPTTSDPVSFAGTKEIVKR